jgi:hypothetical protein
MKELIFLIEDDPFVGLTAKGLGESIFTEAENWEQLKENINDAVKCHFDENEMPNIIRIHYVKDEVIEVTS